MVHAKPSLHPIEASELHMRRERVFLVLASIFIGAMAMLNIIGITHFVQLGPLALAVGVLPYPLTFLCTDLIGELYGRRRANFVVWVGLLINLFVIGTVWLGQHLPEVAAEQRPPWQSLPLSEPVGLPTGGVVENGEPLFTFIYACTAGAMLASMIAYVAAQFCDVYLFHFWKRLTNGRHLWLRNNGSTLVSQLVDSIAVISITFGASFLSGERTLKSMAILVGSNYLFKMCAALADTVPFYLGVRWLSKYLEIDPMAEHDADREELKLDDARP
ncbi:MAG: queuosine precursor transporter [Phycisphaerales bacterium]